MKRERAVWDMETSAYFSRRLIYGFWRNAHNQHTNPLARPLLIALKIVRTSLGFHLRECMGSSFSLPSPGNSTSDVLGNFRLLSAPEERTRIDYSDIQMDINLLKQSGDSFKDRIFFYFCTITRRFCYITINYKNRKKELRRTSKNNKWHKWWTVAKVA